MAQEGIAGEAVVCLGGPEPLSRLARSSLCPCDAPGLPVADLR